METNCCTPDCCTPKAVKASTTKECCDTNCCADDKLSNQSRESTQSPLSMAPSSQREAVREHYGKLALAGESCCLSSGCNAVTPEAARSLGYTDEDLSALPEGANLGLGCGNPQAIAALREGEVVLDLGSGAGIDCFLAARQVGKTGKVIGVDMTPAMINKARENASKVKAQNVEFRLGEIEHLPLADKTVNVIISNCVINLSPEKESVFQEAYRVLAPGGRLAISDVVLLADLPKEISSQLEALTGCVSGAISVKTMERALQRAGFTEIKITPKDESRAFIQEWMPNSRLEDYIASATIQAIKPRSLS
jgi:arsenite methyltransferase